MIRSGFLKLVAAAGIALFASPSVAQVSEVDPSGAAAAPAKESYQPVDAGTQAVSGEAAQTEPAATEATPVEAAPQAEAGKTKLAPPSNTVPSDDVFAAAEGVFGKGAKGLAGLLEKVLKDQGEPVAYIAGQEAGGAFIVGVRYGSGMMRHQVEGERPVYWTGPSIGFDAGADANKVFVLVYNLHDSQDLFRRYPSAEGHAYAVGGFAASYLRRGDVVLIPVRLGVGLRLGINAGYMKFSEKNRWLPF